MVTPMGIGVDILDIRRIEKELRENGPDYLQAVYTTEEIQQASCHRNPAAFFATRFAAKEAVAKCLELPEDEDAEWCQIAIRRTAGGGLCAQLQGHLATVTKLPKNAVIAVSVSWDGNYAIAVAQLQYNA